jgi:putative flippase GtrA
VYEDRLHNPLADVVSARQRSQAGLYTAALKDPRFSSGFGMYPSSYKPKTQGHYSWVLVKAGFVGGLGLFLNQYVLYLLTRLYGIGLLLLNAALSSQVAILANFSLNELIVFRTRAGSGLLRKAGLFSLVSSADLVLRLPLLLVLTNLLSGGWFWANLTAIMLTFGVRFIISEKKIWAKNG